MKIFFSFVLYGIILSLCSVSCSKDDEEQKDDQPIRCTAHIHGDYSSKEVMCEFYFFPVGKYNKDFEIKNIGKIDRYGTITNEIGEVVESIGRASYVKQGYAIATYRDWSENGYEKPEIVEGNFYVVCVYDEFVGKRFPYKAKVFDKIKDKGLLIDAIFTQKSIEVNETSGFQYHEWNE